MSEPGIARRTDDPLVPGCHQQTDARLLSLSSIRELGRSVMGHAAAMRKHWTGLMARRLTVPSSTSCWKTDQPSNWPPRCIGTLFPWCSSQALIRIDSSSEPNSPTGRVLAKGVLSVW